MNIEKWLRKNTACLKGKKIAVTGSTGGLGRELCSYLGSLGAELILLDRNKERSEQHRDALKTRFGIDVKCINVDLECIESVRAATEALRREEVDIFIHNAGAYSIPRHKTATGYDNVYQINFASPYYMIRSLLPELRKRKGRVVAVGSIAHNYSKTDPLDIDFSTRRRSSLVYGNAKRHLMFSLFELFKDEKEVSLSIVHPGITFTNITAHYPKLVFAVIKHPMKVIFMKPRKAVLSILNGVFESTAYCEWIGPSVFDVWGYPKKRSLKTVDSSERTEIGRIAEEVYEDQKYVKN
ncbi:MAG: SDR family NAD(P)-dependent oxidoreductase [Ruminococcaceae bacterium]|nr:SDR family NAD(P)-dependent oxidoreductase [Oscillospiraceae bacterium]